MTDQQRIAEIVARSEAATPGPWKEAISISKEAFGIFSNNMLVCTSENMEDNTFIAHAREDIPWAVDTIKALEAQLAAKDAEIERLREAQRWIPVTERLPEDDPTMKMHKESHMEFCSVLAVGVFRGCEYANPTVSMVNRIRLKKTGIEYIDREMKTEDWHWSAPFESVTHWQPLPAAPEKGAKHERD